MSAINLGMKYFTQYNSDYYFDREQEFKFFMTIRNRLLAERDDGSDFYKTLSKSDTNKLKSKFIDFFKAYYLSELGKFQSCFSSDESNNRFQFVDFEKLKDAVDFWFGIVNLSGFFDSLSENGDSDTVISRIEGCGQSYSYHAAILRHLGCPNQGYADESLSFEYWRPDVDAIGDTAILVEQLYERAEVAALKILKVQLMQQMRIDLVVSDRSDPHRPVNFHYINVFSNDFKGSLEELDLKLTSGQYELLRLNGVGKYDAKFVSRIGRNPSVSKIKKWLKLYFSTDHHLISELVNSKVLISRPDLVDIYIDDRYKQMKGRI